MKSGFSVAIERVRASHNSREVIKRLRVEGKVCSKLVRALIAANYYVSLHDGEELVVKKSRKASEILAAMSSVDEEHLIVHKASSPKAVGSVYLVYGNDGYDVISDYSVSLEDVLAPVNAYAEGLDK